MQLFNALYPKFSDFNDSTAAARLNGDRLQKAEKMSDQELAEYGILGDAMKLAAGGGGWVGNCSI
jgi:hypothetical protein